MRGGQRKAGKESRQGEEKRAGGETEDGEGGGECSINSSPSTALSPPLSTHRCARPCLPSET